MSSTPSKRCLSYAALSVDATNWVTYKEKGQIKLSVLGAGGFKVGRAYLVKDSLQMGAP